MATLFGRSRESLNASLLGQKADLLGGDAQVCGSGISLASEVTMSDNDDDPLARWPSTPESHTEREDTSSNSPQSTASVSQVIPVVTSWMGRTDKPPFSFACLIAMSIGSSPQRRLTVSEIYVFIKEHFPYYREANNGWKNSVRHNLSLNKCFRKCNREQGDRSKGSLWEINEEFSKLLIEGITKHVQPNPQPATPSPSSAGKKKVRRHSTGGVNVRRLRTSSARNINLESLMEGSGVAVRNAGEGEESLSPLVFKDGKCRTRTSSMDDIMDSVGLSSDAGIMSGLTHDIMNSLATPGIGAVAGVDDFLYTETLFNDLGLGALGDSSSSVAMESSTSASPKPSDVDSLANMGLGPHCGIPGSATAWDSLTQDNLLF